MSDSWWLPQKHQNLSQGDIIEGLPVWVATPPLTFLDKQTLSGNRTAWVELAAPPPDKEFIYFLSRSPHIRSVVLTHDCQIDKTKSRPRVQLAAIADIDKLKPDEKTVVANQRSLSQLVLPDIPQLGTYYADMHVIFTVDKRLISEQMRLASMTEDAKKRLQNQVIAYFADRNRPTGHASPESVEK